MRDRYFSTSRQEVADVLGMSAIFILHGDEEGSYLFVSESMADILGYDPKWLIGRSCYITFHPDEIPILQDVHRRAFIHEHSACMTYMRLKHKDGYYVPCAVSYSTVYDKSVGTITRAEYGPLTIKQALTAREVFEINVDDGNYTLRTWPRNRESASRSQSPPSPEQCDITEPLYTWKTQPDPLPRTAFLIDRFTDTSRVMFVTNDIILHTSRCENQSFYSIVKPSDRARVRECIDNAKSWSPVAHDEKRSGGHGYLEFHVLRIPDFPPEGELYPQGTDESERHMPGQAFILVEGIFTAGSDAVICIIERIEERRDTMGD